MHSLLPLLSVIQYSEFQMVGRDPKVGHIVLFSGSRAFVNARKKKKSLAY